MTYLLVDLAVLVPVALATALLLRRPAHPGAGRPGTGSPRAVLLLMLVTALVVGLFTAVFDSLMIAVGLFTYAPEHLVGVRVGLAPVEDFAYVLVAALLLPALWLGGSRRRTAPRGGMR